MSGKRLPDCAHCDLERSERICLVPDGKKGRGCPALGHVEAVQEAAARYREEDRAPFACAASRQEAAGYDRREADGALVPVRTRIEETCEFAARMGYRRIGLAFCVGLRAEARVVADIFESRGFEVASVMCKAGGIAKEHLGLEDGEKIRPGGFEAICNPVLQARLLDDAQTELNVVVGLCVGHDAIFFRHSRAPVTVLAAKDRVTGHNPLAAVYTLHSYYQKLRP